eukprot:scaffold2471_cov149-Pinguiococcus_pyrenoidosus.AAC.1
MRSLMGMRKPWMRLFSWRTSTRSVKSRLRSWVTVVVRRSLRFTTWRFVVFAMALMMLVLPVPGGPCRSTPKVCGIPRFSYRKSEEMLGAAIKSLLPTDDVLLKPGASDLIEILLAQDGDGRVALDELSERLQRADGASETVPTLEVLKSPSLAPFLKRVPLFPPRMHLCGPGGAGKTLLRHRLLRDDEKAQALQRKSYYAGRTRGVEIMRCSIPSGVTSKSQDDTLTVHLFDHGGQQEFQVTCSYMLTQPLSIFVVVIPVDTEGRQNLRTGEVYRKATTPAESAVELQFWLSLLETIAHDVHQVAVVANVFDGTPTEDVDDHVTKLRVVMRRQEGDQDEEGCGRLKFVSKIPIVLDASSSANDWISSGNLFQRLNEAWRVLQTAGDVGSIDLTMPTLCQPLFEAIPRLREAKPHVQDAAGALNGIREELGSLVEFLSDAALATLLEYAEQCGEIILSRETISGGDSMQKTRLAL